MVVFKFASPLDVIKLTETFLLSLHLVKQIGNIIARPATKQTPGINIHNNILFLEVLETKDFLVFILNYLFI
ncbi:hypothetical protein FACS189459_1850 [Bacilli bacterium]|nr:hypothetical protein FACS189459_1850 [Bacilli bacterium]